MFIARNLCKRSLFLTNLLSFNNFSLFLYIIHFDVHSHTDTFKFYSPFISILFLLPWHCNCVCLCMREENVTNFILAFSSTSLRLYSWPSIRMFHSDAFIFQHSALLYNALSIQICVCNALLFTIFINFHSYS